MVVVVDVVNGPVRMLAHVLVPMLRRASECERLPDERQVSFFMCLPLFFRPCPFHSKDCVHDVLRLILWDFWHALNCRVLVSNGSLF